jgi:hypothetical protein
MAARHGRRRCAGMPSYGTGQGAPLVSAWLRSCDAGVISRCIATDSDVPLPTAAHLSGSRFRFSHVVRVVPPCRNPELFFMNSRRWNRGANELVRCVARRTFRVAYRFRRRLSWLHRTRAALLTVGLQFFGGKWKRYRRTASRYRIQRRNPILEKTHLVLLSQGRRRTTTLCYRARVA